MSTPSGGARPFDHDTEDSTEPATDEPSASPWSPTGDEPAGADPEPRATTDGDDGTPAWATDLLATQSALHQDFERLATAVTPLLTKQFREVEAKNRVYEQRLKLRQERPLIVKMSGLLNDVRRLESEADIRTHVEATIEAILTDLGYQPFGAVGDPYDPAAFEAIGGRLSNDAVVTAVHTSGLECFGDVIVRARVDVGRPEELEATSAPVGGEREPRRNRTDATHRD